MRPTISALSLLAYLLCASTVTWAGVVPSVSVSIREDRLWVTADRASLKGILQEIGRVGRVAIVVESQLEERLDAVTNTVIFDGIRMEDGLRRLLHEENLVFVYSSSDLDELRVYAGAAGPLAGRPMTRLPGGRASGADVESGPVASTRGTEGTAASAPTSDDGDDADKALQNAVQALEVEGDAGVLRRALDTLSGSESLAIDPLVQFASSAGRSELRVRALELLGDRGREDRRVIALLQTLAMTDREESVRAAARTLAEEIEGR
jgi:hypothetical protein